MAMVKANAYGHGILRAAQALSGADALGVASLDEGITLRDAGITQPIVLMEGLFNAEELPIAAKYDFTLVVHHLPHVEMLEKTDNPHVFPIWLKINTGMHRLGVPIDQLDTIYRRLTVLKNVKQPIGLMTHFSSADLVESSSTPEQIKFFNQLIRDFSCPPTFANSSRIFSLPHLY